MLRFFRWYCHPDLVSHIEGDLMELYNERLKASGKRTADLKFVWDVLLLFRPGIIRSLKEYDNTNNFDMFINYFKTAWRNLVSSKYYSALNLLGLTLGLTVGLLILLWVNDELHYDGFHSKADQIYRINVNLESSGNKFSVSVVQPTVAFYGLKEIADIEQAVRITQTQDYAVFRYKDVALSKNVMVYTDPSFFKVFDYPLLEGDVKNLFPSPESVVLTQTMAKHFFGDEDPLGKILLADNKDNFVVSGVIADFPDNSGIKCDILFSTSLAEKQNKDHGWQPLEEQWGNYGWVTFLQLRPGADLKAVEEKLTKINIDHQPALKPVDVGFYTLQSLKDLHLYDTDGKPSGMQTVEIFAIVAALILLIASINYVNLFTARATLRSKEVSVRKIIGASRKQLFNQFLVQTLLFFFIALLLALGLISFLMPYYNLLAGKHMVLDLFSPMVWKVVGVTLLVTLLASSIYPAMLLSSFHPIHALRQKLSWGIRNAAFRKILVVCQFAFSVGLIIATLMIGRQLSFLKEKELGYDKSFVIALDMNHMKDHFEDVKTQLLSQAAITGVTSATNNITNVGGATLDVDWDGKDPNGSFFVHDMGIDKDFISLFKIDMAEGKAFSGTASDSSHFILNETAVRESGIKDPIGKRFRLHRVEGTIVGVVKDFHFVSLRQKIEPFVFHYEPVSSGLFVKANASGAKEALRRIEKVWNQYNEGFPFDYSFMDETYRRHYESEQRISTLFNLFTGIAIVISCLGLLGLSTYTAQTRVKEIGIRKVMGASVGSIVVMLSKNFLLLIGIAIVIATPVSLWLMQGWLENFAYQVSVQWWVIGLAAGAAVLIAFFTVSFQSVRVALENPVKSLRSE
jgi:putative ABC transport system permease protein